MVPDGLVTFTRYEIEDRAREILRRRPDVKLRLPVNVELLLELTPDVVLEPTAGLLFQHNVEGCVCKRLMTTEKTVFVDHSIYCGPWPRYNAVLAEEFAHINLHAALFLVVKSVEDFLDLQRDPTWHMYERDARSLSAALRMPAEAVHRQAEAEYERIVDEFGFGDAIRTESRIRNALASTFVVSPEDMRRRMIDWPCNIQNRILTSVQATSPTLVPDDWTLRASPPVHQRRLFPDPAEM